MADESAWFTSAAEQLQMASTSLLPQNLSEEILGSNHMCILQLHLLQSLNQLMEKVIFTGLTDTTRKFKH
jgi:hypothetical protein